jgi:hypothetical protein
LSYDTILNSEYLVFSIYKCSEVLTFSNFGIECPVRDVAMENDLVNELMGDVLDDYDIDVCNELQAIAEYLSLLESGASC